MGFPPSYCTGMHGKEMERRFPARVEVAACAALGNSFHVGVVAVLFGQLLHQVVGAPTNLGPAVLQARHHMAVLAAGRAVAQPAEALVSPPPEVDPPPDGNGTSDYDTDGAVVEDERAARCGGELPLVPASWRPGLTPLQGLVESIIRRVDHRGSDVRLDLGVLYRPSAWPRMSIDPGKWVWAQVLSTPWEREEHINVLELRAGLLALRWRSRRADFAAVRYVHLMDSQVALAVATKGRSSAKVLNMVLVRMAALKVALDAYGVYGYVATEVNPADYGSRAFD